MKYISLIGLALATSCASLTPNPRAAVAITSNADQVKGCKYVYGYAHQEELAQTTAEELQASANSRGDGAKFVVFRGAGGTSEIYRCGEEK